MTNDIAYQFANATIAYRFLNELKHWPLHDVKARLYKADNSVKVSYEFDVKEFDYTCSDLDALAYQYGGQEI